MAMIKWGSNIKARKFDYVPRYYDPEKEEHEQRMKLYRKDYDSADPELAQARIRAGFRQKYRPQSNHKSQLNRLVRLLVILLILIAATYMILLSNMEWLNAYLG